MNMMAHTFGDKLAQREELQAAYDRNEELEAALRRARSCLDALCNGDLTDEDPHEVIDQIEDILDPHKVVAVPDQAWSAVFENGV